MRVIQILAVLLMAFSGLAQPLAEPLQLQARRRVESSPGSGEWKVIEKSVALDPKKTAIVVCDMWDQHWCKGATERVAEMAPRMNDVIKEARKRGIFIIHAPSSTMEFYRETPQRKLAQAAPRATPKVPLKGWCRLDPEREAPLPIDDSDGGCDDAPACKGGSPWKRQIATIEIAEGDAITDSEEAYNLLQQRGIDNVIVMGVHVNMCVLGRPFSIRQMVYQGKNVLLMRDMTDAMYNSRRKPYVSHFRGNELVVEHIEKYWCASVTSADFLGGAPFRFKADKRAHVVFVIGENEYHTWETLPEFARAELEFRGFTCSYVQAPPQGGNEFSNYEVIRAADLLVVSVRRRAPPKAMMDLIKRHLDAGKPLVGIRTASHAFEPRPPVQDERYVAWPTFDGEILGGNYQGHYSNDPEKDPATLVRVLSTAAGHPVVTGVSTQEFKVTSSLYKNPDPKKTVTPLMVGWLGSSPPSPEHPVAWVNTAGNRRVFYTSLGDPGDFKNKNFRRLLLNGVLWCLEQPIPPDDLELRSVKARASSAELSSGHSADVRASAGSSAASATGAVAQAQSRPLTPAESRQHFHVADDLEFDQVLTEPVVRQPVFLNFDERGRMWVVQYIQYPDPAGLKLLSRDNVWRAHYDKVPPPPPRHFRGEDKITIHEDTDGDGKFDKHKTFVEGLNIATAVVRGRGGVWVMNPPYLLFYPDQNNDDVPDGDPVVHLEGFGLEDTHSVANSLRWGPDGWLYAAHGSTVTANIRRPGLDREPMHSMGQMIWRYHPETRRYEVFAEGGGNAFGCEIDSKGRVYSGHNGGNTRGFHYQQGAYLQKGFEKHGPLSNPYAFGYFPPMPHPPVERFTHNIIVYESTTLPGRYHGKLFGVEPLQGRVVWSDLQPDGSSFRTVDLGHVVTSDDRWFKPVDIKAGPDGAIYVADWYDRQVNHYKNHEGEIDKQNGRIYRLRGKGDRQVEQFDLNVKSSLELVQWLRRPDKWHRQEALRLLGDRKDASVFPVLREMVARESGQTALEALWALNLSGGFDETMAAQTLRHPEAYVRLWTVRLLGDASSVSEPIAAQLAALAVAESHLEVRGQLASAAKRLPAHQALPVLRGLLAHDADASDNRMPLLIWWAIESKAERHREAILSWLDDATLWHRPIMQKHILSRLMRRYAAAGTRQDYLICATLLKRSPGPEQTKALLTGFEEAFKGRAIPALPIELSEAIALSSGQSELIELRRGEPRSVERALSVVADESAAKAKRMQCVQVFGEVHQPACVPVLLKLLGTTSDNELQKAAIIALQSYAEPRIGESILAIWSRLSDTTRTAALNALVSRQPWAEELARAIERGTIAHGDIPQDVRLKLANYRSETMARMVEKYWAKQRKPTTSEMQGLIDRCARVIRTGAGNPYEGQKLFNIMCASCHQLFGQGGQIGPDLTTYQRDDLEIMLLSIINPNAEIREGYENFVITTKDERTLSGFLADRDERTIVLRGIDGANISIQKDQIREMQSAGISLMPEALMDALDEQQIRDLFAYLRSTQPLVR